MFYLSMSNLALHFSPYKPQIKVGNLKDEVYLMSNLTSKSFMDTIFYAVYSHSDGKVQRRRDILLSR